MLNSTATRGPETTLTSEQRALISREGRIARVLEAAQRQASGRFARVAVKSRPPNAGRRS